MDSFLEAYQNAEALWYAEVPSYDYQVFFIATNPIYKLADKKMHRERLDPNVPFRLVARDSPIIVITAGMLEGGLCPQLTPKNNLLNIIKVRLILDRGDIVCPQVFTKQF